MTDKTILHIEQPDVTFGEAASTSWQGHVKKPFLCPIDPAEASECDSCQ